MLNNLTDQNLRILDTEKLRSILADYIDNCTSEEFDYLFVKRITEVLIERGSHSLSTVGVKSAFETFCREFANTPPLFEEVIRDIEINQ